jgi:serine protease inhibitor
LNMMTPMGTRELDMKNRMWAGVIVATLMQGCGDGMSTTTTSATTATTANTSTPTAVAQAKSEGAAVNPAIVAADDGFGLRLFQTLMPGAAGNIAVSPLSVSLALQILYNGAAGTTQQAMAQTLQLGALSLQDINEANAALQGSLLDADPLLTIIIANSLWTHSGGSVLPSFTQTDQTYYGAMLGDLAGAPANVNAWISSETQGLITDILPPGNYQQAVAVLANAVYFKGPWTTAFDPSLTVTQPFTLSDGSQVSAPMMSQTGKYAYLQGANFQAVSLPYGAGRLSMLIVLPDSGVSLASFVSSLTLENLNTWIGELTLSPGSLGLPRFTATYKAQALAEVLGSMGMAVAICPPLGTGGANFSALSSLPGVCVSDAEHETVVEVDESGTVAAAATTVTTIDSVASAGFTMTMDRPFLYAIRDDLTGELLFLGALMNPS